MKLISTTILAATLIQFMLRPNGQGGFAVMGPFPQQYYGGNPVPQTPTYLPPIPQQQPYTYQAPPIRYPNVGTTCLPSAYVRC